MHVIYVQNYIMKKEEKNTSEINYLYGNVLKAQNKINIDQVTLYCQNLFTKKDFNTIFNLLKPYYANNNISFDGLKLFINSSYELELLNEYLKYQMQLFLCDFQNLLELLYLK